MSFKFPFTNYHELNLTWVLDQLKKLFEESAENVSVIETYDGRLTAVETELPTVSETASEASRVAAAAGTLAQTAKATADTAQENAIQAQRTAGTAQNTAERAQEAADAATQAAQQAQATAQNFDGRITEAQNNASQALEASRSFENRVQAAITTANNAAQTATNAQGIATRADQNAALALDTVNSQRAELERIGAEQIELITEETESGKAEIEALIDTIPADYTELSELVDRKAPVIIETASGVIASFDDGADNMKIQKLIVNIEPRQAGSGDPSPDNVRPINGWTAADIQQRGKNILPSMVDGIYEGRGVKAVVKNGIATLTGTTTSSGNALIIPLTEDFIMPTKGRVYLHSLNSVSMGGVQPSIENSANPSSFAINYALSPANRITVLPSRYGGNRYDRIRFYLNTNITLSGTYSPMMLFNDSASDYVMYAGKRQISILFPSSADTIYGGKITLNQDGSADIVSTMGNIASYAGETLPGAWLSSMDVYTEGVIPTIGAQVVYELREPINYHITSVGQIKTFLGTNNIWADTGNVEVTYPADTKLYIDGKIVELQALMLENNG